MTRKYRSEGSKRSKVMKMNDAQNARANGIQLPHEPRSVTNQLPIARFARWWPSRLSVPAAAAEFRNHRGAATVTLRVWRFAVHFDFPWRKV